MGQPSHSYSPRDKGPKGLAQPLLALGLSPTAVQRSSMRLRGGPRLVPVPIADRIAQHQHGIDVLSLPAHASPF